MDRKETLERVMQFTRAQKVLDLNMTLGDLVSRIGGDPGPVSDNVFAWDRYVYRTPRIAEGVLEATPEIRSMRQRLDRSILNLNANLQELLQQAGASKLDEVAGWIWDHDRMTFIVSKDLIEGNLP